jgi:trans-aconitate methyltransferase
MGSTAPDLPEWGSDYAANTAHHRVYDDQFLAPLELRGDERVLDIGCGSGDFTAKVADLVPRGAVVGLDPQDALLDEARRVARANQTFVQGAAQDLAALLDRSGDAPFDVVISRAAMHWLPAADHLTVLRAAFDATVPGGRIRLEMGGVGNIARAVVAMDGVSAELGGPSCPWHFSDAGWYLEQLERAGFTTDRGQVRTVAQHRSFDRDSLIGWFTSQVAQAYEHSMTHEAAAEFRARVVDGIDDLRYWDGSYDQVYVRLEAMAHRPPEMNVR